MMQPLSPRSEHEVIIRRTSSTVAPRSGGSSSMGAMEIDSSSFSSYDSKCPPMKLRSQQVARLRSRITFICCGLVSFVLLVNLIVGTEMSFYLSNNHTRLKNETSSSVYKDADSQGRSTMPPTASPTALPTAAPLNPADKSTSSSSTTTTNKTRPSADADNPWFDEDTTDQNNQSNDTPLAPMVANASAIFTERWCDLEGAEWMPSKTSASWQRRAPYFLIPGAKYSGTLELAQELAMHSSIIPARSLEPGFFFQHNFGRYISNNHDKTKVLAARSRMYARDYPLTTAFKEPKSKMISFDATPGYLFYSSTLPRRILCVMPWIRLVIVLRNPVDRVWEHYQGAKSRGLTLSMEEWIDKEFALMNQVDLLNATSQQENFAWHDYQRSTLEGAIGRSLYDIQLRQWFQALRAVGRDPSDNVYVVRAEDLAANSQKEYSAILKFLRLPDASLKNPSAWSRFQNRQAVNEGMSGATKARLDRFFKPYTKRLASVLRRYRVQTGGKLKPN